MNSGIFREGRATIKNVVPPNWAGEFSAVLGATGCTVKQLARLSQLPLTLWKSWAKSGQIPARFRTYILRLGFTRTGLFDLAPESRVFVRRDGKLDITAFHGESSRAFAEFKAR